MAVDIPVEMRDNIEASNTKSGKVASKSERLQKQQVNNLIVRLFYLDLTLNV